MTLENLIAGSDTLPKRRPLSARTAGQELLVSDPDNGKVHFFNATAAFVWECCDGQTTLEQCVQRFQETFAIPENVDIAADIREILADLNGRGLLEEAPPDA